MNCKVCGEPLYLVNHVEDDGFDGSYEPYYECPNGCPYPERENWELTEDELRERGIIDTGEYYISVDELNEKPEVIIL